MSDIVDLLINLIKNMSVVIVLAYVLTRTKTYSAMMKKQAMSPWQQIVLVIIFGIFSIYGTLSGINIMGAIANIRDLGPAVAGLIGGPLVGLGAGLIGGIHRYTVGGLTAVPCSISTVIAGIVGGLIYRYRKDEFIDIKTAVIFMALIEMFHMGLSLAIVKPFDQIYAIIKDVSLPMICTNALGMGIFAFINNNLVTEREILRQKELIEGELTVARQIQMSIIPKIFPAFPGRPEFDIYGLLEPAKEVGGDLYDYFLLDNDHLCFTIGDVSGKGVPASLFMAVTKTLIKAKADIAMGPEEILYAVNSELSTDNDSSMFVTEFLGILTISSGEILYSNGGHNPPYILRQNGVLQKLPVMAGMALGAMENMPYTCASLKLNQGDSLIMYTDGVTEAMNGAGDLFNEARLEQILTRLTGQTVREEAVAILNATREFADGAMQSDDITIVALQYLQA
ncbi:MAG TPA: LytS/YhcK type 5TM receptor domain-containing protein [Syntrophomonas sp.]|nr:LytS/YhcK type 5TM receptor domain-containing protein [Syntrophomonas sp.]